MSENHLLNTREASQILGVKQTTMIQRRWRKRPPNYVKINGQAYYDIEDVKKHLEWIKYRNLNLNKKEIEQNGRI